MRRTRGRWAAAAALVAGSTAALALAGCGAPARPDGSGSADPAGSACAAMTVPVRYQLDPSTSAGLLTTDAADASAAAAAGYTTDDGTVFAVATRPGAGLVGVHQLRKGVGDQLWTTDANEVREAVQGWGYADQGVVAYVSPVAAACTVAVQRFQSHGVHRYAATTTQQEALRVAGWVPEGSFYAARAPGSGPSGAGGAPTGAPSPSPRPSPSPSPRPTGPQTVIDANFDAEATGPVTPDSFIAAVGPTTHAPGAYDSMTYVRAEGGGAGSGQVVRTHLAPHEILGENDAPGDGNVLVVRLPDQTQDTACVSYDVRFSPGFEVSAGGKLPGLLGVAPGVSPGTPTGGGSTEHGWSGRVMWLGPSLSRLVRDSGQPDLAVTYLYHPGQTGTFGDDLSWGRGVVDGAWHSLRQCYTLNTVGQADGVLQAWVDGTQVLQRSDLVYRTDPAVHITHLDWSVFRGGDTDDWAASTGGDVDLDNLVVTVG